MVSTKVKDALKKEIHSEEDISDIIDYLLHQQQSALSAINNITQQVQLTLREEQSLQNIKIEGISSQMYMCERSLSRKLKIEGTSFRKLLNTERHVRCINLMLKGVNCGEELSEELGYTDSSYFYKVFHRWTGLNFNQAKNILSENHREFVRLLPSNYDSNQ